MPLARAYRLRNAAAAAVIAVLVAAVAYASLSHSGKVPIGSGCQANTGKQAVSLTPGQAGIAATIAGVAADQGLPQQAVTIAYATALQESKLSDLSYGDLDSVGVFQQRPSQGWGTPQQLEDPVYASTRFFQALVAVPGYQQMPVYQAAQSVQHSADGSAYMQYQQVASWMAAAFTGSSPRQVWCWYDPSGGRPQLGAAGRELARTFGTRPAGPPRQRPSSLQVPAPGQAEGWAVAGWLVTHAASYGLASVRYDGYAWHLSSGQNGWLRDPSAPSDAVRSP